MRTTMFFMLVAAATGLAACVDVPQSTFAPITTQLSVGTTDGGVTPRYVPGNIPGGGDAVCASTTVNPLGAEWLGFKADPPFTGQSAGISHVLTGPDNEYLTWSAQPGVIVHAVVVKGGPDTHIYDYNPPPMQADQGLHAPLVGQDNVPAISHFEICYTVVSGPQGCTPGYWKNRALVTGDWTLAGYNPAVALGSVFAVPASLNPLPETTLLQAIDLAGGTGIQGASRILARAAVAALLSAAHPHVDYPLTAAQVMGKVDMALARGTNTDAQWRARMLLIAGELDGYNNAGCPLGASYLP